MKTLCLVLSELKMPTVFTRKNNEFSCLYDRKLMQSYTTSQDGLTCPDKYRSQSHRVWWQMPAKQSGKTIFQTLTSCFFLNRTLYACKYASQFFRSFTIRPTWSCTYGDVCCFGAELPGLQHFVASSASDEKLIASSELNSFSFAKNSENQY